MFLTRMMRSERGDLRGPEVSRAERSMPRRVTHTYVCGHVYDDIDMVFRVSEQSWTMGQKDTQEDANTRATS